MKEFQISHCHAQHKTLPIEYSCRGLIYSTVYYYNYKK